MGERPTAEHKERLRWPHDAFGEAQRELAHEEAEEEAPINVPVACKEGKRKRSKPPIEETPNKAKVLACAMFVARTPDVTLLFIFYAGLYALT